MAEKFRRMKWDEFREIRNSNAVLKTASYDLGTQELAFSMSILEPGQGVHHHSHAPGTNEEGAEEVYFLMSGECQVRVEDETYQAKAIEVFYFAPEVMRSVYNNSDKPATWVFLAPMREAFQRGYARAEQRRAT